MAVAAVEPQWTRSRSLKRNKKQAPKTNEGFGLRVVEVGQRAANTYVGSSASPRPAQRSAPAAQRRAVRKNLRHAGVASSSASSHTAKVVQASRQAGAKVKTQLSGIRRWILPRSRASVIAMALATGFATAIVGGLGAAHYLQSSPLFSAQNLSFEPTAHVPMDEVRARLAPAVGQSLWALDLDDLQKRLESAPWVASARVVRMFPDTLGVEIQEHRPVARAMQAGQDFLVDSGGELFQIPDPSGYAHLPMIHGLDDQQVTPPEQRERRLQIALDALERFASGSRPALRSLQVGAADEIALELRDIPTRLHFAQSDLDRGLARFDALYSAAQDRFSPEKRKGELKPWSAVFFNGADRNRVVVRYADEEQAQPLREEAFAK